jgi:hypothetical protein
MLATRLAGRLVVPTGRDARLSGANVRRPAAAQLPTAQPFALDGLPGTTPRRPRSVAGWGTRLRRVLLRWQAPQPALRTGRRGLPGPLESRRPLRHSLRQPLRHSLRVGGAYPWLRWPSASVLVSAPSWGQSAAKTAADWPPSGGVERPGRVVRFARLIHRPVRVLGVPSARAACGGTQACPSCHLGWSRDAPRRWLSCLPSTGIGVGGGQHAGLAGRPRAVHRSDGPQVSATVSDS